ncbi:hypothetical protein Tco_1476893 [Tanacetum coccineum]
MKHVSCCSCNLSELEMKKILIDKMERYNSINSQTFKGKLEIGANALIQDLHALEQNRWVKWTKVRNKKSPESTSAPEKLDNHDNRKGLLWIEYIYVFPTRKKSRWRTIFPTGLKRYKEPLVEPKEIG